MKRIASGVLSLVLVFGLGSCSISPVVKQSATEVKNSHTLIATALMDYVKKDSSLDAKAKARFQTLVDTDKENLDKLMKALEE